MTSPAHYTDSIIRQLEQSGNQDLRAMPDSERSPFIAGQIEKAQNKYGMGHTADILLFCTLALAGGADFDLKPRAARILKRVREEHIAFGQAYWQDYPATPLAILPERRSQDDPS
ncbi:MAG: hypothetical protein V7642_5966 [Burkholderiales bacterium]|jgi:hypothetical protein